MRRIRLALRSLLRTPLLTAVAVVSLALGIGANAAIYSLMDATLLRSLPVQEPERLVNLEVPGPNPGSQSCGQAGGCDEVLSYPMLRDLQAFEGAGVAALAGHVPFGANLAIEGSTTNGGGAQVTGNYFDVLGIRPALGRLLQPADDENVGVHPVVVLSWRYWQDQLGGDPGVLNKTLIVNGQSMTVVGVAPRGFRGTVLGADPDVFIPLTMRGAVYPWFDGWENRRWYWAYAFARLAPGATLEQAERELSGYYNTIIREVEVPLQGGLTEQRMEEFRNKRIVLAAGYRGQSSMHEEVDTPFKLLLGITGLVLLIACANIANLLLARGAARQTEMALRGSLGAGRGQLLSQLMSESLILAGGAGVLGVVVGQVTLSLLARMLPPEALQAMDIGMNGSVVLFTGAVAVGTGIVFGLYPAIHASRPDLATLIRAGSGKDSGAKSAARLRNVLVTAQIALSMALLVGAGLFARSLTNVARVDLGLEPEGIVQFAVSPGLNGYSYDETMSLFVQLEDRLAATPGVTGVTASLVPVLAGSSWGNDVSVDGFHWEPGVDANSRYTEVGPGFYATMGIPLLVGREFTPGDALGSEKVAVVNEAFLEKFGLELGAAVGTRIARGTNNYDSLDTRIVGVVRNAAYSDVKDDVPPVFALPYRQNEALDDINFYVRVASDRETVVPAIRREVAALDPNLPVEDLRTMEAQIRENILLDRLTGTLSLAFAALATLLAAVGLYGVLSFAVAQRTREIGVRMALGAGAGSVRRLVLRQVVAMTVVGGIIGLGASLWLGRLAESQLFGVDGTDGLVMVATTVLLATVAVAAGYFPARRASRIDPIEALRGE